jgi:transposase
MPSKSPAQARLMAAAARDPAFARRVGLSQGTAQEWHEADKKRRKGLDSLRDLYGPQRPPQRSV